MTIKLSSYSIPTGPGSRGGRWHDPEWRKAYHRAWRRAHPEYRVREALRRLRDRAMARGDDPTVILSAPLKGVLPASTVTCECPECNCTNEIMVIPTCGMCQEELHDV